MKQRAELARKRRLKTVLTLLGVSALIASLVWVGWFSPLFVVRKVSVVGVGGAEAVTIADRAGVPRGTPLLRVDRADVHARVLKRLTVSDAAVERSWPSTIVIKVVMRTPVLAVKDPDGRFHLVDRQGTRFDTVDAPPDAVPLASAPQAGGLSKEALAAAVSVVQSLPDSLSGSLKALTVAGPYDVTVRFGDVDVKWGGADDALKKARIVEVLLAKEHPHRIDVSSPNTPVIS